MLKFTHLVITCTFSEWKIVLLPIAMPWKRFIKMNRHWSDFFCTHHFLFNFLFLYASFSYIPLPDISYCSIVILSHCCGLFTASKMKNQNLMWLMIRINFLAQFNIIKLILCQKKKKMKMKEIFEWIEAEVRLTKKSTR